MRIWSRGRWWWWWWPRQIAIYGLIYRVGGYLAVIATGPAEAEGHAPPRDGGKGHGGNWERWGFGRVVGGGGGGGRGRYTHTAARISFLLSWTWQVTNKQLNIFPWKSFGKQKSANYLGMACKRREFVLHELMNPLTSKVHEYNSLTWNIHVLDDVGR